MVAISPVKISNLALSHLGANSTIESLTENSTEAVLSNLWYDFSRIQALEAYDWNFARKRQALAVHSEDPPEGVWGFRYQYPADAIIMRKIENPVNRTFVSTQDLTANNTTDAVPFEIEVSADGLTRTILTDMEDACGVYTFDQELTELYSQYFVEALSFLMAQHMCISLTGKLRLKEQLFQQWLRLLGEAPAHNANENVDRPERDAPWIRARS